MRTTSFLRTRTKKQMFAYMCPDMYLLVHTNIQICLYIIRTHVHTHISEFHTDCRAPFIRYIHTHSYVCIHAYIHACISLHVDICISYRQWSTLHPMHTDISTYVSILQTVAYPSSNTHRHVHICAFLQTVEYRSSARKQKKSDHRGRIRSIRLALQPKGWKSVGYR